MRTQGPDEPVQDFLTCLEAILRKMDPPQPTSMQLDRLHRNLKPELQRMVRRNDFDDVETLLELAVEAELTLDVEKRYKPPPSPDKQLAAGDGVYASRRMKNQNQGRGVRSANFTVSQTNGRPGDGHARAIYPHDSERVKKFHNTAKATRGQLAPDGGWREAPETHGSDKKGQA